MEGRLSRASAVFVQQIPLAAVNWFQEWQKSVTSVAETFAGYQGTDVYPATEGEEWVVIVHFADDASLQQWLASPSRAQWVEKLRAQIGEFNLKTLLSGFSFWFPGLAQNPDGAPPSWKLVLAVLLALYPLVMLLTIFIGPLIAPLGLAGSMLIANALSVVILQWGAMPLVGFLLGPWLKANQSRNKFKSIGGVLLILVLLVVLALLFRLVTG
jgi:antibiotic biosynthesis monooxygenase (ABM) superfamily enzyme